MSDFELIAWWWTLIALVFAWGDYRWWRYEAGVWYFESEKYRRAYIDIVTMNRGGADAHCGVCGREIDPESPEVMQRLAVPAATTPEYICSDRCARTKTQFSGGGIFNNERK